MAQLPLAQQQDELVGDIQNLIGTLKLKITQYTEEQSACARLSSLADNDAAIRWIGIQLEDLEATVVGLALSADSASPPTTGTLDGYSFESKVSG